MPSMWDSDDTIRRVIDRLTERELARQAYMKMFDRYLRYNNIKPPAGMLELGRTLVSMGVNVDEIQLECIRQYKESRERQ